MLLKHEFKMNRKPLLIWSGCVGIICFGCILLFESISGAMAGMADLYAKLGAFSTAFGMDRLNIGTMEGFYGAEVSMMFAIGGGMFAAMTGAGMLSKEEEGHTCEFLNTLPLSRGRILRGKYLAAAVLILGFQVICMLWELAGFALAGELPEISGYLLYHGAQLLMQWEIGSLCFLLSSVTRKKQTGGALGLAVLLYMADLMCRVLPKLSFLKYITPYYFSNAADLFLNRGIDGAMAAVSISVTAASFAGASLIYSRKDLYA